MPKIIEISWSGFPKWLLRFVSIAKCSENSLMYSHKGPVFTCVALYAKHGVLISDCFWQSIRVVYFDCGTYHFPSTRGSMALGGPHPLPLIVLPTLFPCFIFVPHSLCCMRRHSRLIMLKWLEGKRGWKKWWFSLDHHYEMFILFFSFFGGFVSLPLFFSFSFLLLYFF